MRRSFLIALLIVALAGVAFVILEAVNATPDHVQPPKVDKVAVTLGGPASTPAPGAPTITTLAVPPAALLSASKSDVGGHDDARNETPPGAPPAVLEAARVQQDALAASDQLPIVTPDAAPSQPGCRTSLVANYSSRRGVRPRLFVPHYTASPNRPGWSDVDAIVSIFNQLSFAASSNYVIDNEGNCAYIVRESDKAWTQAAANPVSISVEVVNTGREGTYVGAGLAKLGRVVSDATARWSIPLQRGKVAGCTVVAPGIVDHHALGACGGGHVDITPYGVDQVIQAAIAYRKAHAAKAASAVNVTDRVRCRRLTWWRTHGRPHGLAERRAVKRRTLLEQHGVKCAQGKATLTTTGGTP